MLRIGKHRTGAKDTYGPPHRPSLLLDLSTHFPTLTALDLGYATVEGGVQPSDVGALCTKCAELRHLDLSMVMTYVDFGPALRLLAAHAPHLTSLAIDGLATPADDLLLFGQCCTQLTTLFLLSCRYSVAGLAAFLAAATRLTTLDLSYGDFPRDVIFDWIAQRESTARPVERLVVCSSNLHYHRTFPIEGEEGEVVVMNNDVPFQLRPEEPEYKTAISELAQQLRGLTIDRSGGDCGAGVGRRPLEVITGGGRISSNWRKVLFATADETNRLGLLGECERGRGSEPVMHVRSVASKWKRIDRRVGEAYPYVCGEV